MRQFVSATGGDGRYIQLQPHARWCFALVSQTRRYNRTAEYEHCHTNRQGTHCPGWTSKPDPNALTLPHGSTNKRGCNFGMGTKLVEADLVATFFQPGFVMSAAETLTPQQVTKYDSLSVTLQFAQQGKKRQFDPRSKCSAASVVIRC